MFRNVQKRITNGAKFENIFLFFVVFALFSVPNRTILLYVNSVKILWPINFNYTSNTHPSLFDLEQKPPKTLKSQVFSNLDFETLF